MNSTELPLVQDCPDHPGVRLIEGFLYSSVYALFKI